jgi:hypothetical protein
MFDIDPLLSGTDILSDKHLRCLNRTMARAFRLLSRRVAAFMAA